MWTFAVIVLGLNKCFCGLEYIHFPAGWFRTTCLKSTWKCVKLSVRGWCVLVCVSVCWCVLVCVGVCACEKLRCNTQQRGKTRSVSCLKGVSVSGGPVIGCYCTYPSSLCPLCGWGVQQWWPGSRAALCHWGWRFPPEIWPGLCGGNLHWPELR